MARRITPTLTDFATRDTRSYWVIDIDYEAAPFRIWNGEGEVTIDGIAGTFLPSEAIAAMGDMETGTDPENITMGLQLSAVDPTLIDRFQSAGHGKIAVRVWKLYSDPETGAFYSAPHSTTSAGHRFLRGALDLVNFQFSVIEDGNNTTEIAVPVESRWYADRGIRHRGAEFTQHTQKLIDPDDTSWRFLPYLQRASVLGRWGPPPVQPRSKRKISLLGIIITAAVTYISGGTAAQAAGAAFLSFVQQDMARRQAKKAANSQQAVDTRIEIISNDPVPVRRFVFGKALVGGDQLYIGLSPSDNVYLQMVVLIADHSIEAVDEFWVGNGRYTADQFVSVIDIPRGENNYDTLLTYTERLDGASVLDFATGGHVTTRTENYQVRVRMGGGQSGHFETQTRTRVHENVTSPNWRSSEWDPAVDRATGSAIIAIQMKHDQERVIPWQQIRFLVRGDNTIWDPRTNTTGYSNNPALVIGAYLNKIAAFPYVEQNADGTETITLASLTAAQASGTLGGIDVEHLKRAADVCDTNGWTIAGAIDHDSNIDDQLPELASAMMGWVFFDGWNYIIRAAEASDPVATITDADIKDVTMSFHRRLNELYNSVGGTIRNDEDNGHYENTSYPELIDADALAEDVTPARMELNFLYVPDTAQALQLASIALARNRAGKQVRLVVPGRKGWQWVPGDRITLDIEQPLIVAGIFIVNHVNRNPEANMTEITLVEDPDSVYTYSQTEIDGLIANIADATPPGPDTAGLTLTAPTAVTPFSEDRLEGNVARDGTTEFIVVVRIEGGDIDYFIEVERYDSLGGNWIAMSSGNRTINPDGHTYVSLGVIPTETELRLRARYTHPMGLVSDWTIADPEIFVVERDTLPPNAPTGLSVDYVTDTGVRLLIRGVQSRDLSSFDARYTISAADDVPPLITTEAEWDDAARLQGSAASASDEWHADYSLLFSGNYRVYVRAVDDSGNLSVLDSVNVVFDFRSNSGVVSAQFFNSDSGWAGCTLSNLVESGAGRLLPLTGRTGSQADDIGVASWNSTEGWLFNPTNAPVSMITLPILDLGATIDGIVTVAPALNYPVNQQISRDSIIANQLRYYHHGTWSAWTDMDYRLAICASRVQYRCRITHQTTAPLRSFGITSIRLQVSTSPTATAPAIVPITDATAGVSIAFGANYVNVPLVTASVNSLTNQALSVDDYEVITGGTTTREGVTLRIRRKGGSDLVTGTIIWESRGLS